jgi:hypothetical protein
MATAMTAPIHGTMFRSISTVTNSVVMVVIALTVTVIPLVLVASMLVKMGIIVWTGT